MDYKRCSQLSDIPATDHYVIIEFVSVNTPGDERSRTNPGHGYSASTEHYTSYLAYTDKEKWLAEVSKRSADKGSRWSSSQDWKALIVKVPTITVKTEVSVD